MDRRRPGAVVAGLLLALVAACGDDGGTADRPSLTALVAEEGWKVVEPAEVGLDAAALDRLAEEAAAAGSHCLVVSRDGVLAGEWSWADAGTREPQEVYSITKSVTATMVGIAVDDGLVDIDQPASRWIEEWAGTPSEAVTVRNLLANDSGRHWTVEGDYEELLAAQDRTAYAVGLGQDEPPGEVWIYNNAAIQALERVLSEATGTGLDTLVAERVLEPLGMSTSHLATDAAGRGAAFLGLQSTCRDLARFGLMVLDGGRWGDEQIVSEAWIEESTGRPSQELNTAYGLLWWLNLEGHQASEEAPTRSEDLQGTDLSQMVSDAPEDLVWAIGLGGQVLQIHPSTRTVVVRLGPEVETDFGHAATARVVTEAVVDG